MSRFDINPGNIPAIEVYNSLVNKADIKFSKIRDVPYYERNRNDAHFYKVFKVYTQLWKFQQDNRQSLVEAGLKRWEIGEIASRIGQLYYGQYMKTSEANLLSEAYIFYEALWTREYFREGMFQGLSLANKQLRFLARFMMVCLILNRNTLHQLITQLKFSIDECKRAFQETDFKEWKLVVQEIVRFLKVDTTFMTTRPLRYSLVLDPLPDTLPHVATSTPNGNLQLRDAVICSYHSNEVKFSELTLDAFRMLQCLEWEPSGALYKPPTSNATSQLIIADYTLPPNPRKAVLYRPSTTHLLAVLATTCEQLPADGVLLIYLSASGSVGKAFPSPLDVGTGSNALENVGMNFHTPSLFQAAIASSPMGSFRDIPSCQNQIRYRNNQSTNLYIGSQGNGDLSCIGPSDLLPFTRRPLFIVIDSDISEAFKSISGTEKGEPAALLLSPVKPFVCEDSSNIPNGSLFTLFITAPLIAFCLVVGKSGRDIEMDTYNKAEELLSSSLNQWGTTLATSETLHPVWGQILRDPFLRRLLLRFLFCRAVLTLHTGTFNKREYQPECLPPLPSSVLPTAAASQIAVLQIAHTFGVGAMFNIQEDILNSDYRSNEMETILHP